MMAGVETVPVAYRGGTTQILELLAGRVDFLFETMPTAMPFIADGRVRVVAVTTKQRWAELPDAPTMADTLPGYEVISFLGVAAPGGTPGPIIAKLNSEIRHVLDHADIRERFKALGGERRPATASETQAFVSGEIRKWKDVVSARGIERQ